MSEQFRLLTQAEINLLRWLAKAAGLGRPVTLGARHRQAVPALWRMHYVDVWFRAMPHDEPQASGTYFSLSLSGLQRAQPFLSSRRAATAARTSPPAQRGQDDHGVR